MTASSSPHVGRVSSADIAVPEHAREVAFYARVLTSGDDPLWKADLMNNQGDPVIGLGERIPEYAHLPLQWMPHIQVPDVGRSVDEALRRGGDALMHHIDEQGRSQWAVLLDPQGAAFGIIPVMAPAGGPRADVPDASGAVGRIVGLELAVADAAGTRDFYEAVVGWFRLDDLEAEGDGTPAGHTLGTSDGEPVAFVRQASEGDPSIPSVWMIQLPVGDLEESLRRAAEEGGEILVTTLATDGAPAKAVVRDPVGACFALVAG